MESIDAILQNMEIDLLRSIARREQLNTELDSEKLKVATIQGQIAGLTYANKQCDDEIKTIKEEAETDMTLMEIKATELEDKLAGGIVTRPDSPQSTENTEGEDINAVADKKT